MRVKRFILMSLVMSFILVLMSVSVQAQETISEEIITAFEQIVQDEMEFFNIPGAAIAIIQGDEVIYAEGFGLRNIADDAPFTNETQFRVGSTTKSMTSLLVAQLVEEGLLSWDTPVTDLFPDFYTGDPEVTEQVTVADLMGMGTGLVSSAFDSLTWDTWDINTLLNAIGNQAIDGEFREFYSYNNEVYALAGYAATVAAELEPTLENYTALMQERVFDPIGMESAIITDDLSDLNDNYSESYEVSLLDGELVAMGQPPISFVAPAGAVWTNIEDMAKYVITQMNGGVTPDGTQLVSEDVLARTWESGVEMPTEDESIEYSNYAMGWVNQSYQGVPLRYHDGGWVGYSTQMLTLPEDDVALIVFANGSYGAIFGAALNFMFVETLHDLEPRAADTLHPLMEQINTQLDQVQMLINTDFDDVSDLVGTYEQGWSVVQHEDESVWLSGHGWDFQLGYISLMGTHVILNNGAAGTPITFDTESEPVMLIIEDELGASLELSKLD